jgi:hypothetical protein
MIMEVLGLIAHSSQALMGRIYDDIISFTELYNSRESKILPSKSHIHSLLLIHRKLGSFKKLWKLDSQADVIFPIGKACNYFICNNHLATSP